MREAIRERILLSESNWAIRTGEINKMVDQGVEVIERNLKEGRIGEVTDKVINYVAFKVIEQYY